jgi:hypothetical protein
MLKSCSLLVLRHCRARVVWTPAMNSMKVFSQETSQGFCLRFVFVSLSLPKTSFKGTVQG